MWQRRGAAHLHLYAATLLVNPRRHVRARHRSAAATIHSRNVHSLSHAPTPPKSKLPNQNPNERSNQSSYYCHWCCLEKQLLKQKHSNDRTLSECNKFVEQLALSFVFHCLLNKYCFKGNTLRTRSFELSTRMIKHSQSPINTFSNKTGFVIFIHSLLNKHCFKGNAH